MAAVALCFGPALVAQGDDCSGALAVTEGTFGPFSTVSATVSAPAWPCAAGGGPDVWFVYTPSCNGRATADTCGAGYDTAIQAFEGSGGCNNLVPIICNDDALSPSPCNGTTQSSIDFSVIAGGTYYIRVGGWNGSSGTFSLNIACNTVPILLGVAESMPGAGALLETGGPINDGQFARWTFHPYVSGLLGATVFNFGAGGPPATGTTMSIPGFSQLWSGSNPSGFALVHGAFVLPATGTAQIPPGFFNQGDTVRLQGVVLDPVRATGSLPVVPTVNTITFQHWFACQINENFDNLPLGTGNYPTGWANGGGIHEWRVMTFDTPSSGTGPEAAYDGPQYMYCETSSPVAAGDTFIMNTAVYPSGTVNAVSFALSRVGSTIGTLELRLGDGSGTFPALLQSWTGASASGFDWDVERVPVPASGRPVQLQFHYSRGSSFTGDVAIDYFCVQ